MNNLIGKEERGPDSCKNYKLILKQPEYEASRWAYDNSPARYGSDLSLLCAGPLDFRYLFTLRNNRYRDNRDNNPEVFVINAGARLYDGNLGTSLTLPSLSDQSEQVVNWRGNPANRDCVVVYNVYYK